VIDTLNIRLDRIALAGGNPLAIANYLTDIEEGQSEKRGYWISGRLKDDNDKDNYKISAFQWGISIKGSLAKYYLPSNVYTHKRATIQRAIEKMSDELHIDVSAATVSRLDISTVIPTQRPPADYYPRLGDKPYFKRLPTAADTLEYRTSKKRLIFYDKAKEAKAKRAMIPPNLTGCNLLRYELRYFGRLQKQLKQADPITAAALYNPKFYYMLVQQWRQEFDTIKKIHRNTTVMEDVKTVKEAEDLFFARLIQQGGGKAAIDEFMADIDASNAFGENKTQYKYNLKAKLNKRLLTPIADGDDIIVEIEKAVENYARYAV